MSQQPATPLRIPCCLCGTPIAPNAANQCPSCLASQFDLAAILNRGPGGSHTISVHQCRRCRRYELTDNSKHWGHCDPESPELLRLCLKRIPALQGGNRGGGEQALQAAGVSHVHLVDASWVWTEPHSMRLKVRVTVRAEVGGGARAGKGVTIQQRVLIELVVQWRQCPDCNREYTSRTWHAVVQLRQRRSDGNSRRGLVLLEHALAKNAEVRKHVLSVDPTRHGFDFYFLSLMHARLFASYAAKICPMRIKTTQKLVSTDVKNNTANVKHTVSCDVVPLCRHDLVIVDKRVNSSSGGGGGGGGGGGAGRLAGKLCLVDRVSSVVRLVDASPTRSGAVEHAFTDVHPDKYWRGEKHYHLLFSSTRLVKFVVLDVELCGDDGRNHWSGNNDDDGGNDGNDIDEGGERKLYAGPRSGVDKHALADVEVVRESDFGVTSGDGSYFSTVTHLGNLLAPGDTVLGYDMASSVLPSEAEWCVDNSLHSGFVMPDVVLVKKVKGDGGGGNNDAEGDVAQDQSGSGGGGGGKDDEKKKKKKESQRKKAKSSGSKRREKRKGREERKAKELEETVARMGFLDDARREADAAAAAAAAADDGDGDGADGEVHRAAAEDAALLRKEREAFGRELEHDPELAWELDAAERVLMEGGAEMDLRRGGDGDAAGDDDDDEQEEEEEEEEDADGADGEPAANGGSADGDDGSSAVGDDNRR